MTHWELTRMLCYSLGAPALLYLGLFYLRNRMYANGMFYVAVALLFGWYLVDLTAVATGTSVREARWIATLPTIVAAVSAVWMAMTATRLCRVIHARRKQSVLGKIEHMACGGR